MSLTPDDIQPHRLKRSVGGYDREETDELLDTVVESYRAVWQERARLQSELDELRSAKQADGERVEDQAGELSGLREWVKNREAEVESLQEQVRALEGERDELRAHPPQSGMEELETAGRQKDFELELLREQVRLLEAERSEPGDASGASAARIAELEEVNRRQQSELDDLRREQKRRELHEHVRDAETELTSDPDVERRVGRLILSVERVLEKLRAEARHEAELSLKKARERADEILRDAEVGRKSLEADIAELRARHGAEAELVLEEARAQAGEIVSAATARRGALEQEVRRLEALEDETRKRYQDFLNSALESLRGEAAGPAPAPEREFLSDLSPGEGGRPAPVPSESEGPVTGA